MSRDLFVNFISDTLDFTKLDGKSEEEINHLVECFAKFAWQAAEAFYKINPS